MQSFLILGSNPSISFAEIYGLVIGQESLVNDDGNKDSINSFIVSAASQAIIVDDEEIGRLGPGVLGGVPKSGEILEVFSQLDARQLSSLLLNYATEGQKFHFGLSMYEIGKKTYSSQKLKALGLEIKKNLKASGLSVRLVESRSNNLSSVDVIKNKLIDKGVELCVFSSEEGFVVGRTLAVQPFEQYSDRDYGRPGRNAKRGMLPPKLARIMVNLSAAQAGDLLVDPFCGVGTVLQEALLMGYKVIGTDVDERAVRQTKKNIEWLLREHKAELPDYKIDAMDVRKLDKAITEKSVDAIVTEFDLGPPLLGDESSVKIESIEKSLSEFYAEALDLIKYVLKDGKRAVVAWPYFVKQNIFVSVFDKLESFGFRVVAPYPEKYNAIYPLSERGTLLYGREGQHVFREIVILEKI